MQVDSQPTKPKSASTETAHDERVDPPRSANSGSHANASTVAIVQEMLSRVKTLEKRLTNCRSIVRPLLPVASME